MQSVLFHEVRSIAMLALPLVIGMFISVSTGLIDTAFASQLGKEALACVSMTTGVIIFFYAGLYGFTNPVSLFVGRAFGAGDSLRMASIIRHAMPIAAMVGTGGAVVMALFFAALPALGQPPELLKDMHAYWLWMCAMLIPFTLKLVYKHCLDAMERAWTSASLQLVTPLSNALYAYLVVTVWEMGLQGIGLASFLASLTGLLACHIYFRIAPSLLPLRAPVLRQKEAYREQLREGAPISVQYFLEAGALTVAGLLIGWLGATALAANQIVLSTASFLYMLPLGLAAAVGIRIAQAVGIGAFHRLRQIGLTGMGLVSLWMLAFTLLFILAGESLAMLYVDAPAIISTAAALFVVVGVMQIFDGVQSVAVGCLRGLMDNRWPMWVSIFAYWAIALPLAYGLGFTLNYGAPGIWLGFGAGLLCASVALVWRFLRMAKHMAETAAQPVASRAA